MFKENNQLSLLRFDNELPEKIIKRLKSTPEYAFYELIFQNICERDYQPLFSDKASRPNIAVNVLLGALILKERRGYSFDDLIDDITFDLKTKYALGLVSIGDIPFGRATLFNFQKRLQAHEEQTGINLLETTFDRLTAEQLKSLQIKTDIQRMDSVLISSNIRKYNRVQLLIEVLLRFFREVAEEDQPCLKELLDDYLKWGSEKYCYQLKSSDLTHELEKLGKLYQQLLSSQASRYGALKQFEQLQRVYQEHFTELQGKDIVEVKDPGELGSDTLQSPDDEQSTFRTKRGEAHQGVTINASETANPDNEVQLLTDVAVNPNNVDDATILQERIDPITEKTPDLEELHTDGGYGSKEVDEKMEEQDITLVTTAIRGRKKEVDLTITPSSERPHQYRVACPEQAVTSVDTKTRHKAQFDTCKCEGCPLRKVCRIYKNKGAYYFDHATYLQNKRGKNIDQIPAERRKLRPNVEVAMKEFKHRTRAGKVKVRGLFKMKVFAFTRAIGINFGRIYRSGVSNPQNGGDLSRFLRFWLEKLRSFDRLNALRDGNRKDINMVNNYTIIRHFCCA